MVNLDIKFKCEVCGGSGTVVTGTGQHTVPCTNCNGDGFASEGYIEGSGDLIDKVNDIIDKLDDILEKLP